MNRDLPETVPKEKRPGSLLSPFRIALIYAVVGELWILFSDTLLARLVSDQATITRLSIYKGWVYVLITAMMLYCLVRGYAATQQASLLAMNESKLYNRALFEQSPIGLALCRVDGSLIDVNEAYAKIIGRTVEETLGQTYWQITPEKYAEQEQQQLQSLLTIGSYGPYEKEYIHKEGRLVPVRLRGLLIKRGGEQCIWSSIEDITERRWAEKILTSELEILERISSGAALPELLEKIVLNIESLAHETIASILLLDPDGLHVHYGAAPNLPEAYNQAIEGAPIGPSAGSCGTAAYRREPVIVSDIETDPLWADYRELARAYGLRACWSTPIMSSERKVLGTFAMYYRQPRSPGQEDFKLIARATHIAEVAIERSLAEEEIKIANRELSLINRIVAACSSSLDTKEIFNRIMEEAVLITGLEGGTICMVGTDDTLHLAAHKATSEATIADLTTNTVKVGDCLCGECARDQKPLILPDREAVLKFSTREATRGEDIRFHAAFPLLVKGKCLGVLCIFTRTEQKPTDRSLKLLETVTAQIALAIESARLHEDTLRHAATLEDQVRERTADLKAKIAEIERINKLFVGRELKMVELKGKIKELESRIQ